MPNLLHEYQNLISLMHEIAEVCIILNIVWLSLIMCACKSVLSDCESFCYVFLLVKTTQVEQVKNHLFNVTSFILISALFMKRETIKNTEKKCYCRKTHTCRPQQAFWNSCSYYNAIDGCFFLLSNLDVLICILCNYLFNVLL